MLHRRDVHLGKKEGALVGKTKSGKGTKFMVLADGAGTPLGVHLEKMSPSEVKLVEATLANVKVKTGKRERGQPKRLIGDKGYDSNTIRALLVKRGIEPIIPARSNNMVSRLSRELPRTQLCLPFKLKIGGV